MVGQTPAKNILRRVISHNQFIAWDDQPRVITGQGLGILQDTSRGNKTRDQKCEYEAKVGDDIEDHPELTINCGQGPTNVCSNFSCQVFVVARDSHLRHFPQVLEWLEAGYVADRPNALRYVFGKGGEFHRRAMGIRQRCLTNTKPGCAKVVRILRRETKNGSERFENINISLVFNQIEGGQKAGVRESSKNPEARNQKWKRTFRKY